MKKIVQELSKIIMGQLQKELPKAPGETFKTTDNSKKVIKKIKRSIKTNGYRSIEVRRLFHLFGYKRRGTSNLEKINHILSMNNLYSYPSLTMDLNFNDRIKIYNFPVECRGDLFKNEKALQNFIYESNAFEQLNLHSIQPEYSPGNTSHRMDFLASDGEHNVVIEVKNEGGQERGVEQVLRYASMIRREDPVKPVRKILITGQLDPNTAKAIHGMTAEERNNFEWYLYKYKEEVKLISFEKVDYSYVFSFFTNNTEPLGVGGQI